MKIIAENLLRWISLIACRREIRLKFQTLCADWKNLVLRSPCRMPGVSKAGYGNFVPVITASFIACMTAAVCNFARLPQENHADA